MIGIYDSGIGGFTVLQALRSRAPNVDIVYFGDTKFAPYANLDQHTLERLTLDAFRLLKELGATQLVSACNSVSASVVRPLLDIFGSNGSIIEMVGPTAQYINTLEPNKVVVIATPATIRSGLYQQNIVDCVPIACPHLSGLIEAGANDSEIEIDIKSIVDLIAPHDPNCIVLGCTHYPLVKDAFAQEFENRGIDTQIIDPAGSVSSAIVQAYGTGGSGSLKIFSSSHSEIFNSLARSFFGVIPEIVESRMVHMTN